MIAYEELVSALAMWRERNGLPVGNADYLGAPPPPTPVSFAVEPEHDVDLDMDGNLGSDVAEYAEPAADVYPADFDDGGEPAAMDELSADDAVIDESADYASSNDASSNDASSNEASESNEYANEPMSEAESGGEAAYAAAGGDAEQVDELQVAAEYDVGAEPSAEDIPIDADDAIIGEELAAAVPDDATAPQDYADDPALYPAVDGPDSSDASSDASNDASNEDDVAMISNPAPTADGVEAAVDSEYPPVDAPSVDVPLVDATQQGIAPAPPAPGDEVFDADAYPSVSEDPTVEGFRPLGAGEADDDDGS